MSPKRHDKKLARALQRLTGRSYTACLHHIREHGASTKVHQEVDRWRRLSPELREIEKEAQRAERDQV